MRRGLIPDGSRFGRLKVVRFAGLDAGRNRQYLCLCDCGTENTVRGFQLKAGTLSCGCLQVEKARAQGTHRQTGSDEYRAWQAMWHRCTNPKFPQYHQYKDRVPPERWKSFENFLADMGPKPSKAHTIERVRNDEAYGPANCCWATREVQNNNTSRSVRCSINGSPTTLKLAAALAGISYHTLRYRLFTQKRAPESILPGFVVQRGET